MFKNVALGVIAVSTVGTLVWIGYPYIKALYEVFKREESSEPEDIDDGWDDIRESIEMLENILGVYE